MNKTRKRTLKSRVRARTRGRRGGAASEGGAASADAEIKRESEKKMKEKKDEETKIRLQEQATRLADRKKNPQEEARIQSELRKILEKHNANKLAVTKSAANVANKSAVKELTLESRVENGSRSWSGLTPFPKK